MIRHPSGGSSNNTTSKLKSGLQFVTDFFKPLTCSTCMHASDEKEIEIIELKSVQNRRNMISKNKLLY